MPAIAHEPTLFIPLLQIRHWGLLLYSQYIGPRKGKLHERSNQVMEGNTMVVEEDGIRIEGKAYSGTLARDSSIRIKKAVNTLMAIAEEKEVLNEKTGTTYKFKLNFITLTLPGLQGEYTDKQIKRGPLRVWIQKMGRRFGMHNYVWKAETQENGNIHFHITTDVYIPWWKIRDNWNAALQVFGYLDRFEEKHGHRNPNSTDVHSVRNVKDLAAYIVKYMSKKEEGRRTIEGKVWGCSKNLTGTDRAEIAIGSEEAEWLNDIIRSHPENLTDKDHCSFIRLKPDQWKFWIRGKYLEAYEAWKQRVRDKGRAETIAKRVQTGKTNKKDLTRMNPTRGHTLQHPANPHTNPSAATCGLFPTPTHAARAITAQP